MHRILVAYFSRTSRTRRMAEDIADGVRLAGAEADVKEVQHIREAGELEGYDACIFGAPTYFRTIPDAVKVFLFLAQKANLEGKVGGAFGSYTHIGSAPQVLHDTMAHVYRMDMGAAGPFNIKEQVLDAGKGREPCQEYGRSLAERARRQSP